jgi:hypothetical protein
MPSANGSSGCSRNFAASRGKSDAPASGASLNPNQRADRAWSLFCTKELVLPMFYILGTY